MVLKRFCATRCTDTAANHQKQWNTLQRIQRWHDGPHAERYKEVFAMMDKAYPGQWRAARTGGDKHAVAYSDFLQTAWPETFQLIPSVLNHMSTGADGKKPRAPETGHGVAPTVGRDIEEEERTDGCEWQLEILICKYLARIVLCECALKKR
jgi:hypothetical protein